MLTITFKLNLNDTVIDEVTGIAGKVIGLYVENNNETQALVAYATSSGERKTFWASEQFLRPQG